MLSIAEGEQARGRSSKVDDDEEECRKRIDPEMRAEPGKADRQGGNR